MYGAVHRDNGGLGGAGADETSREPSLERGVYQDPARTSIFAAAAPPFFLFNSAAESTASSQMPPLIKGQVAPASPQPRLPGPRVPERWPVNEFPIRMQPGAARPHAPPRCPRGLCHSSPLLPSPDVSRQGADTVSVRCPPPTISVPAKQSAMTMSPRIRVYQVNRTGFKSLALKDYARGDLYSDGSCKSN